MHSTLYAQDHLVHFYHLHALDWVDVVSALKADPRSLRACAEHLAVAELLAGLLPRSAEPAEKFVEGGQLGIFANGYWGIRRTSCRRKRT